MKLINTTELIVLPLLMFSLTVNAQTNNSKKTTEPQEVVKELYNLVTFKAGETPDWDKVKSLFLKDAVIVLRTSRDSSTIFTLEEFVQDFTNFIEKAEVKETGFIEKIVKIERFVLHDIAHFFVVYEASIPGSKFKPQTGLDSFQLIKRKDGWKIVSIVNEIPTKEHPLPDWLKEKK